MHGTGIGAVHPELGDLQPELDIDLDDDMVEYDEPGLDAAIIDAEECSDEDDELDSGLG
jgi:hypothetical protein